MNTHSQAFVPTWRTTSNPAWPVPEPRHQITNPMECSNNYWSPTDHGILSQWISLSNSCHDHDTWSTLYHAVQSRPMRLPPIPLYVPMFPNCLYFLCITTDRWVLCLVCLSIWLLNVFLFTIPVTNCSRPVILTNTVRLGESAMNITELTHSAARTALVDGLPDSPSIALYILQ